MNTGLLSSLLEMVVLGHGIGIGRITVSKRILIVVRSYSVSLFACWFVYLKLGCLSWFDCFEQTYLNAYGMECLRMKKIFPTCLMKQPPLRLAGIWLTMFPIVVSFSPHPLFVPIILWHNLACLSNSVDGALFFILIIWYFFFQRIWPRNQKNVERLLHK